MLIFWVVTVCAPVGRYQGFSPEDGRTLLYTGRLQLVWTWPTASDTKRSYSVLLASTTHFQILQEQGHVFSYSTIHFFKDTNLVFPTMASVKMSAIS
jgi:hypothetical protein